ncbi:fibronectin type III domain-containing protein [Novosphingobium sp.]|uniref:fibronectin type III domain-containing protein n=1 Tax=Novosphingobium sp. TaxID=1874826 RepID=UPI0038B93A29
MQPIQIAAAPNYFATAQSSAVSTTRGIIMRRPIYIGSAGASELRASFSNTFTTRSAESGNSVTVKSVYLEKGDGSASVQLTFDAGAATSKTLAWLDNDIQSDPVLPSAFGLSSFAANSLWWERIVFEVALTTDKYPTSVPIRTAYTGFTAYKYDPASFASLTASGTGAIDGTGKTALTNNTKAWGAIWLGRPAVASRSYLCRGDSWTRDNDGDVGTNYFPLRLFSDIFERALVNEAGTVFEPFLNCGVYGSSIYPYSSDPCQPYYKYATDLFCELGINNTGATAGQLQGALSSLWAAFKTATPAGRIWRTKYLQPTTSTDSYVTEANQTVASQSLAGGVFYATNDWFDTKVSDGTLAGVIPLGRARSPSNFYKWRVNDGVANWSISSSHPTPQATIPSMAAEIRATVLLNASAAPAAPVLTTSASDRTITATWTQSGATATDHLVEISPAGANTWTSIHTYDGALAYAFTGLTTSTSYDIKVTAINAKGSSSAATATVSTVAQPMLLLDGLTATASAVYSSRRLRGAYTGAAYRVMRTIDKMEMDLGFGASGDLNTALLSAWAMGSSVRIKYRYDQSVNGYKQAALYTSFSVVSWPWLVINGTIQTVNGKAAEAFTGGEAYNTTTLPAAVAARTVYAVAQPTAATGSPRTLLGVNNTGGLHWYLDTANKAKLDKFGGNNIGIATAANANGSPVQLGFAWDGSTAYTFRRNGASDGSASNAQTMTTSQTAPLGSLLGSVTYPMLGQIAEMIVFEAALSGGDQTAIEAARSYWGA